jgi:hypothetical protein
MRRYIGSLVMAGALITSSAGFIGCSGHVRYYDTEYHDYHPWNHEEIVYYNRWETDTHREHRDFDKRSAEEQKQYWEWRHQQH